MDTAQSITEAALSKYLYTDWRPVVSRPKRAFRPDKADRQPTASGDLPDRPYASSIHMPFPSLSVPHPGDAPDCRVHRLEEQSMHRRISLHPSAVKEDRIGVTPYGLAHEWFQNTRQASLIGILGGMVHKFICSDVDAVSARLFTEPFEWTDGLGSKRVKHAPLLSVKWRHGATTYIDVKRRSDLERDPGLSGSRSHIEAECLARRAFYEVWTEREIVQLQKVGSCLRAADGQERAAYAAAGMPGSPKPCVPPLIRAIAARLGIEGILAVGDAWIGRDVLTGVPNVVMGGIQFDPSTGMATWSPPRLEPTLLPRQAMSRTERRRAAACSRPTRLSPRDGSSRNLHVACEVAR